MFYPTSSNIIWYVSPIVIPKLRSLAFSKPGDFCMQCGSSFSALTYSNKFEMFHQVSKTFKSNFNFIWEKIEFQSNVLSHKFQYNLIHITDCHPKVAELGFLKTRYNCLQCLCVMIMANCATIKIGMICG